MGKTQYHQRKVVASTHHLASENLRVQGQSNEKDNTPDLRVGGVNGVVLISTVRWGSLLSR